MAHIAWVACAEEVGDVVDDDYIDAAVDSRLEDVGQQVAVRLGQVVVEVVGCEDGETGRVLPIFGVLGIAWEQLVLGVLEVEVEDALTTGDDVGSNFHGKDGLAHIGFAKEACHFALVPKAVPEVDGWRCGVDNIVGSAGDESGLTAGILGIAFVVIVDVAVLEAAHAEVVGDGVFLFWCHGCKILMVI